MFDQTPIEERHAALGVFTAIGLAGLGAVYLLITGGFASIAPRIERESEPPVSYAHVVGADRHAPEPPRAAPTSYTMAAEAPIADTGQDLSGGADSAPLRTDGARPFEDIERDIEALYEEPSCADEIERVAVADDEPLKDEANASESESPW